MNLKKIHKNEICITGAKTNCDGKLSQLKLINLSLETVRI